MSNFFAPITFSPSFSAFMQLQGIGVGLLEKIAYKVDNYFDMQGRQIRVVKEAASGSGVFCLEQFRIISTQEKILKILSYILLLPLIILLLAKIILRLMLFFKYGAFLLLNKEILRDLLLFHNEEYYLSKPSPRVLKDIWSLHKEIRSGLTKGELQNRGIHLVLDFNLPNTVIVARLPTIIFRIEKYPGAIFSSFPSNSNNITHYLDSIRILETQKIFDGDSVIRCQSLPPIEGVDAQPFSLTVQSVFDW